MGDQTNEIDSILTLNNSRLVNACFAFCQCFCSSSRKSKCRLYALVDGNCLYFVDDDGYLAMASLFQPATSLSVNVNRTNVDNSSDVFSKFNFKRRTYDIPFRVQVCHTARPERAKFDPWMRLAVTTYDVCTAMQNLKVHVLVLVPGRLLVLVTCTDYQVCILSVVSYHHTV